MAVQNIEIIARGSAPEASGGCGCCSTPVDERPAQEVDDGVTTAYAVTGMTCGHCVGAVTRRLGELAGVTGVDVDLVAGGTSTVRVTSTSRLPDPVVAVAVDEAGYSVVGA